MWILFIAPTLTAAIRRFDTTCMVQDQRFRACATHTHSKEQVQEWTHEKEQKQKYTTGPWITVNLIHSMEQEHRSYRLQYRPYTKARAWATVGPHTHGIQASRQSWCNQDQSHACWPETLWSNCGVSGLSKHMKSWKHRQSTAFLKAKFSLRCASPLLLIYLVC